jgi:outer membrane protein TolC
MKGESMLKRSTLIFALSLPTMVSAAEVFSWQKCIEMTYQNNAELSGADANIKSSQYQKKAVRADFLPKVSAGLSWAEQKIERQTTNFFNSNNNNNGQSYAASLNGSLNLFSGLKDYSRLSQAEASVEVANAKYITTKARI